jgi:hypothetical protein
VRESQRYRRWTFAFLVNEVDVTFSCPVTVLMESRKMVNLQLPIKRIHPVAGKIDQEIAIDAE